MRVAILDDHKMITDMVMEVLEKVSEIKTKEAFTSHSPFIEFLKNNEVNLVILDIFMPKINGLQIIKEIREFNKDLKIIVLSSSVSTKIMKDVISLGANAYVTKQDAMSDLIAAMQHFKEKNIKPF
ncbi:MAG: response regulator transcription factor [Galbibacter orientalis]|uniref:response regulator n=1 Tax=Galbibacter orientalis TaxID=453852 RepID=UPI0030018C20